MPMIGHSSPEDWQSTLAVAQGEPHEAPKIGCDGIIFLSQTVKSGDNYCKAKLCPIRYLSIH